MRTPIRKSRKIRKKNPNSGWHLCIHKTYGKVWSTDVQFNTTELVYVRKIWFGAHRLVKRDKKPKYIFKGCKYQRYMESEWGKKKWLHGVKNGTFKTFLEKL